MIPTRGRARCPLSRESPRGCGSRWFNLLWLLPIGLVLLIVGVALAKELRGVPAVQSFIGRYPGTVEPLNGEEGIPAWVAGSTSSTCS